MTAKEHAEDFARIVADWSVDKGISATNAVFALSGTAAWAEARAQHRAGASEHVCRQFLDSALAGTGMAPQQTST